MVFSFVSSFPFSVSLRQMERSFIILPLRFGAGAVPTWKQNQPAHGSWPLSKASLTVQANTAWQSYPREASVPGLHSGPCYIAQGAGLFSRDLGRQAHSNGVDAGL